MCIISNSQGEESISILILLQIVSRRNEFQLNIIAAEWVFVSC